MIEEQLAIVGDLVRFKERCVPWNEWEKRDLVYLVSEHWGGFIRLHGRLGMHARDNFDIVCKA
tara:strand:+ start:331 stop:519 length:189 start_codon:yes stop_codon:yes gene_type:complete